MSVINTSVIRVLETTVTHGKVRLTHDGKTHTTTIEIDGIGLLHAMKHPAYGIRHMSYGTDPNCDIFYNPAKLTLAQLLDLAAAIHLLDAAMKEVR